MTNDELASRARLIVGLALLQRPPALRTHFECGSPGVHSGSVIVSCERAVFAPAQGGDPVEPLRRLEAAALADEKVRSRTAGKTVAKVIVVPGKLVNLVVK